MRMKGMITLFALSVCFSGINAQSVVKDAHLDGKTLIKKVRAARLGDLRKRYNVSASEKKAFRIARLRASADQVQEIWKPTHEKEFYYDGGEWFSEGDYYYTYDKKGQVLTNEYVGEGYSQKLFNTYNENGLVIEQIEQDAEEDGPYTNAFKKIAEFDPFVIDCPVLKETYGWMEDTESWKLGMGNCYKRLVTRDDEDRVKNVEIKTFYDGNYESVQKHMFTYDTSGEGPSAYKFDELVEMDGDVGWDESLNMQHIVWNKCNSQLTYDWTAWLEDPNNQIKSCDLYYYDTQMGTLGGEYTDKGQTVTMDLYMMSGLGGDGYKMVDKKTMTDESGSFELVSTTWYDMDLNGECTDDEKAEIMKIVVQFDDHGNEVLYEEYGNDYEGGEELFLMGGTKTTYTYDEHGATVRTEYAEYVPDFDDWGNDLGGGYEPFLKIEALETAEVTNIQNVNAVSSENAKKIYGINGTFLGGDLNKLAPGLYLIQQNGKTMKILKK